MLKILFTILAVLPLSILAQAPSSVEITPVSDQIFVAPTSPIWHAETQSFYFCDVYDVNYSVGRFDYQTNEIFGARIIGVGGAYFVFPVEGAENEFIVGWEHQILRIFWDGRSSTATIIEVFLEIETDPSYAANSLHFAKVDPENRFYFGTKRGVLCKVDNTVPFASFYVYTKENGVQQIDGSIRVAGGYGWNLEEKLLFAIDDCTSDIFQYSYTDDGTYYDKKTLVHISQSGISNTAMDSDGHLWVNSFNATTIYQIDTTNGNILRELDLPTTLLLGQVFGGPNLDTLFVVTASEATSPSSGALEPIPGPSAGKLFVVTGLGATGVLGEQIQL